VALVCDGIAQFIWKLSNFHFGLTLISQSLKLMDEFIYLFSFL
jgi:hypothetical protein